MSDATDFMRYCCVRRTSDPLVFEGVSHPQSMGNVRPIAYGGFAVATAIVAAGQTLPSEQRFVPYSLMGNFLGPASLDAPYTLEVVRVRDTRTFVTRYVTVKQASPSGTRSVLAITLDLIASPNSRPEVIEQCTKAHKDPAALGSVLRYSPQPSYRLDQSVSLAESDEMVARQAPSKKAFEMAKNARKAMLGFWYKVFDVRVVPESILTQNMAAMLDSPTTQDKLPFMERRSYDWFRLIQQLPSSMASEPYRGSSETLPVPPTIAHCAVLSFALDGLIPFAPLSLAKKKMTDASAASTLEFAVRFHTDVLNVNAWHLREIKPVSAGWSRTFGEALIFLEDGTLVATASQQSVLRPVDPNTEATNMNAKL